MKKISLSLIILLSHFLTFSQDQPYKFSKVIPLEGISKDEIYTKSLLWCSKTFNNSNEAIKVKEKENGLIAGKGRFQVSYKYQKKNGSSSFGYYTTYDIDWTIEIRDGKLRFSSDLYSITAPSSQFESSHKVTNRDYPPFEPSWSKENVISNWKAGIETAEIELAKMVQSLTDEIKKNSNW